MVDLPASVSDPAKEKVARVFLDAAGAATRDDALGLLGPRGFEVATRVASPLDARDALLRIVRNFGEISGGVPWRVLAGTAGAAPLDIRVAGPDRSVLEDTATRAQRRLGASFATFGIQYLGAERDLRRVLRLDRARAADAGVQVADAEIALRVAQGGIVTGRLSFAGRQTPVIVRGAPGLGPDRMHVRAADGRLVALADLVSIVTEAAPERLLRENGRPEVIVRLATLAHGSSFEVRVRDQLAREIEVPEGYTLTCAPARDDE